jgi:hypothetical protein
MSLIDFNQTHTHIVANVELFLSFDDASLYWWTDYSLHTPHYF